MDLVFQNSIVPEGVSPVCGLDEAGRGPLAGPVFAAAVILPEGLVIEGLDDSKKLSEKKRDELEKVIKEKAVCWAVARSDEKTIDEINILNASLLAMKKASLELSEVPALLLVDGNIARGFTYPAIPVVKGDARIPCIAAASILAKTARDRYCLEMDRAYPQYGFAVHKGYPTKAHREAIIKYGPCPLHRKSFLKKILYQ